MNKIDLIIDALARSVPVVWTDKHQADRHMEALAAARELKALKPVAWVTRGTFSGRFQVCDSDDVGAFQVYALDEVTA